MKMKLVKLLNINRDETCELPTDTKNITQRTHEHKQLHLNDFILVDAFLGGLGEEEQVLIGELLCSLYSVASQSQRE